jgi:hypothetical protein
MLRLRTWNVAGTGSKAYMCPSASMIANASHAEGVLCQANLTGGRGIPRWGHLSVDRRRASPSDEPVVAKHESANPATSSSNRAWCSIRRFRGRDDANREYDLAFVVPEFNEIDPADDDRDSEQASEPDSEDVKRHERH